MYIDKNNFEAWMERIMNRFDKQDKTLDKMSKRRNMLDGELLLDNQDLCQLLHVSKRTLQRYRSTGELPFQTVYKKTYYKESDVHKFIRENFNKGKDDKPSENHEDNETPEDIDNP
ncbi:helix-turn-helix domain-containing protein [Bacteroides sp. 51]|uniref:helix-turn-helix domain-containing protein n=1 Tax=Bacteroides sp. 51 TaxID=2302938 RepID=UPI0013D7AC08|nr:helix-turn-helix domain-containing protein [Bacteroides sp. 51]NDV83996.1 DNA-binding protein [Bacteroides sp. 51]